MIAITGGKNRRAARAFPDDIREMPVFSIPEIARYLRMNSDSLSDWTKPKYGYGRQSENFGPLIKPAGDGDTPLSFYNAIEAHMLIAARSMHKVPMLNVRRALEWTTQQMPSAHPLIDYKFQTNGKHLFVSKLVEEQVSDLREAGATEEALYNASLLGQREISGIVELFLQRIARNASGLANRLFPIAPHTRGETRPVMMDISLASGQLVIADSGVSAYAVYGRYKNAGHSIEKLARDYRLAPERIEGAINYLETAA